MTLSKMIYMGSYNPEIFECVVGFKKILVEGVILDKTLPTAELDENREILAKHGLRELEVSDIYDVKPDIIFLCGYTKLLKGDLLDKYLFVNVHAGILPKWRGHNANCTAILNGEREVGYTLHRVRAGMDDGEIFNVTSVKLGEEESYSSARHRIKAALCPELEKIFLDIISGDLPGKIQPNAKIAYSCKLRREDGDIKSWDRPSFYLDGLMRVFGEGSGVRMNIRGETFKIVRMSEAKESAKYISFAGAVLNKYSDGSVIIKSADTAMRVYELEDEAGHRILPSELLKIGMRL